MNILHHDSKNSHELAERLSVGGFCVLVAAVAVAIVIANLNLL